MTIRTLAWKPDLTDRHGPKYRTIADALADDIASGKVHEGMKLPPHRELSWELGVTVGTITRAYQEAERRGLVSGEVGRGTYVRSRAETTNGARGLATSVPLMPVYVEDEPGQPANLSLNYPPPGREIADAQAAMAQIIKRPDFANFLSYQPNAGMMSHREAAAKWMAKRLPGAHAENTLVASGGQHGTFIGLSAVTQPGQIVATEALSYGGLKSIARNLGIALHGLPMDEYGLIPEAFETYCRNHRPAALYTVCTPNNPTNAILPVDRRQAIAQIAIQHDVIIIEDDIFALLLPDAPPPVASFAPDHAILVTSAAKTLAPGLRVGIATGPDRLIPAMEAAIRATCGLASPITAEIFRHWVDEGIADAILKDHCQEIEARHQLFRERFDPLGADYVMPPGSMHAWLYIPAPDMASDYILSAARRGVTLGSSGAFVIDRNASQQAVRVCLGTPRERKTVERALDSIAALYREGGAGTDIAIY